MLPINFVAVTVAAVSAFILGFLFHGPLLGRLWMKLANVHPTGNEKFSDMIPKMLQNLVTNFVTASVLAVIYLFASTSSYLGGTGTWRGVVCALWLWLGFWSPPPRSKSSGWGEKRPCGFLNAAVRWL